MSAEYDTVQSLLKSFEPDLVNYLGFFTGYSAGFLQGKENPDCHIRLKLEHTLRVLSSAWHITLDMPDKQLRRVSLLSALFHDLGRFEQFARYHTFADALSVNHGILGAKLLKRLEVLKNEPAEDQRRIVTAVLLHNRATIPSGLSYEADYALRVVRDADKLDILRVMAQVLGPGCTPDDTILLHLKDEPDRITSDFEDLTQASLPLAYTSMRYLNDFRVLLCSWIRQLSFDASFTMAVEQGYLEVIANGLYGVPAVQEKVFTFLDNVRR